MWVKVDDNLPAHHKLDIAGRQIGRQATGRVLAIFVEALCWTNKHNTNGFLPVDVVPTFRHDRKPLVVADAMVRAKLWEPADGGWRIHDWHKYQLDAATREAIARARSAAGRKGGLTAQANARALARTNGSASSNGSSKRRAKSTPVPVPVPLASLKQGLSRAGEQPLPPSGGSQSKPKHQPKTTGAWRCPHIPQCASYDACIKRTLDDANDRS